VLSTAFQAFVAAMFLRMPNGKCQLPTFGYPTATFETSDGGKKTSWNGKCMKSTNW